MTTPAVAPYVPYYASTEPYITINEFYAEPTGVDTSQLMPGQGAAQNQAALAAQIVAASSYADSLCYQVLAATSDLQSGEYRVGNDGCIRVAFDYSPVLAITGASIGYTPGELTPLSDLSGVWPGRKVWRIPVLGVAGTVLPPGADGAAVARRGSMFAQVQYVNGYANTSLAAPAVAGASSITVSSALGLFPGVPLTIIDDITAATEQVTVAAAYVPGSALVPLAGPLVNAHAASTAVSALPKAIKKAVVALTAHLIKTRGAESLTFASTSGGPSSEEKTEPGASEEYDLAVDLLHPFRRVI